MRLRDLTVLLAAERLSLWHYAGRDLPLARLMVPGFFDDAAGDLRRGDWLALSGSDGHTIVVVGSPAQGARLTVQPLSLQQETTHACPTIPLRQVARLPWGTRLLLRVRAAFSTR